MAMIDRVTISPLPPPHLVDIGAKYDSADGAHQKAGAKDREGHHQRGEFTARRKKVWAM